MPSRIRCNAFRLGEFTLSDVDPLGKMNFSRPSIARRMLWLFFKNTFVVGKDLHIPIMRNSIGQFDPEQDVDNSRSNHFFGIHTEHIFPGVPTHPQTIFQMWKQRRRFWYRRPTNKIHVNL